MNTELLGIYRWWYKNWISIATFCVPTFCVPTRHGWKNVILRIVVLFLVAVLYPSWENAKLIKFDLNKCCLEVQSCMTSCYSSGASGKHCMKRRNRSTKTEVRKWEGACVSLVPWMCVLRACSNVRPRSWDLGLQQACAIDACHVTAEPKPSRLTHDGEYSHCIMLGVSVQFSNHLETIFYKAQLWVSKALDTDMWPSHSKEQITKTD